MSWSTASTCTRIAAEAALIALLLSCAGRTPIAVNGGRGAGGGTTAGPAEIEILADVNEIARPYRMVGYVEAERDSAPGQARISVKDLLPALKEKAGRLGAHALIELETHALQKEGRQGLKATAIAIVFTD